MCMLNIIVVGNWKSFIKDNNVQHFHVNGFQYFVSNFWTKEHLIEKKQQYADLRKNQQCAIKKTIFPF